jgi:predicted site-specific integrase-resolvase
MMAAREQTRRAFGFREFAAMFGISRDTAKRLAKTGVLRTILIGGRRLVPMAEIERVEKEGLGKGRKAR